VTSNKSSRSRATSHSVSQLLVRDSLCADVSTIYRCVNLLILGSVTHYVYPREYEEVLDQGKGADEWWVGRDVDEEVPVVHDDYRRSWCESELSCLFFVAQTCVGRTCRSKRKLDLFFSNRTVLPPFSIVQKSDSHS